MKFIKVYSQDTQTHYVNTLNIVKILEPTHSTHNSTEIHLVNGTVLISTESALEIIKSISE